MILKYYKFTKKYNQRSPLYRRLRSVNAFCVLKTNGNENHAYFFCFHEGRGKKDKACKEWSHQKAVASPGCWGWGQKVGGLGDGSPAVGSRGEAPVGDLGDEVRQKLKRFCKLMY